MDDATARYFQLREVQLQLDRITCEIGSWVMPLSGVIAKLKKWDSKDLPKHKEYSDKLEVVADTIHKEHGVALIQVLNSLGNDLDAAFKIMHPDSEDVYPLDDNDAIDVKSGGPLDLTKEKIL